MDTDAADTPDTGEATAMREAAAAEATLMQLDDSVAGEAPRVPVEMTSYDEAHHQLQDIDMVETADQQQQQQEHPDQPQSLSLTAKQTTQQLHVAVAPNAHYIHALLPADIKQAPELLIFRSVHKQLSGHRQGKDPIMSLVLREPLHCVDTTSAGLSNLVHWCSGPLVPDAPDSPHTTHTYTAQVTSHHKAGFFSRTKKHEAILRLSPSCKHHYLLDPSYLKDCSKSAAADSWGLLLADMVMLLCQQRPAAQDCAVVAQQLQDLAQQCSRVQQNRNTQQGKAPAYRTSSLVDSSSSDGSTSSDDEDDGSKPPLGSSEYSTPPCAGVLSAVVLIAQKVSDNAVLDGSSSNIEQGTAGPGSRDTAAAVLSAWAALLLLSAPGTAAMQRQFQALAAAEQRQVQQSLAVLMKLFAVMGSQSFTTNKGIQGHATAAAHLTHGKRSWEQMSEGPTSGSGCSTSSSSSETATVWLGTLQQTLIGSITIAAANCIMSLADPTDISWFETIPALYNCMKQPSLGFLWAISRRLQQQRRQYGQHTTMISSGPEALGQSSSSRLQRYMSASSWVYCRLHAMNPHITSNPQLLEAAVALAPGLPGLMHLMQIPQLQQAYGGWQLTAAVDTAVKQASLHDLLTCWADMSQAMQAKLRGKMQCAAVSALMGISGSCGGSTATGAAGSSDVMGATDAVHVELLYGSLFDGPLQLLRLLVSSSGGTSRWPASVSYKLVPAALQLVMEQQHNYVDMKQQQQSTGVADAVGRDSDVSGVPGSSLQQQLVQQTVFKGASRDPDVLNLVESWLQHVDITAADMTGFTAATSHLGKSSRDAASAWHLYNAAQHLLQHCPSTTWGDADTQQLLLSSDIADSILDGLWQYTTPDAAAAAAVKSQNSLLPYVLEVLETAVAQMLHEGQYRAVLSLAGSLVAAGCCHLLQQHYLNQFTQHRFAVRTHTTSQQQALEQTAGGEDDRGKGLEPTTCLKQWLCSSWQSADLLISAVLGCEAGDLNISQPATPSSNLGSITGSASVFGNSVTSGGVWQEAHSRRSKKYKATQQQQQQQQDGITWLQQRVLVLLLDALLEQQQDELSSTDTVGVPASASTCSNDKVLLLQTTEHLLEGHPLWLKLLQASSMAGNSSKDSSSSSNGQLQEHPMVQQVLKITKQLMTTLTSMSYTVAQLQRLQQQQQILTAFATALEHIEPTTRSTPNWIKATLTAAAHAVRTYEREHQLLGSFYTLLCPVLLANTTNLEEHTADLAGLVTDLTSKQLRDLSSAWGQHQTVLEAAELVAPVLQTTPFINSVRLFQQQQQQQQICVAETSVADKLAGLGATSSESLPGSLGVLDISAAGCTPPPTTPPTPTPAGGAAAALLTVSSVCDLVPDLLDDFSSRWARALGTHGSAVDATAAKVLALWVSETLPPPDVVAAQYRQIFEYINSQQVQTAPSSSSRCCYDSNRDSSVVSAAAVSALLRLHHNSRDGLLSNQLTALQSVFQLTPSSLLAAAQQLPAISLVELQIPAAQLACAYEDIEQQLGILADHPELLTQLARSEGLGEFLAAVGSEDLRRLADGVEDHGDSFLRSAVLSDLIEVNRLMRQLRELQGKATVEQLLQQVVEVAATAAQQNITHSSNKEPAASRSHSNTLGESSVSSAAVSAACGRLTVQLRSCIEHLHGFNALYKRLSNRGELTREVVGKVIQRGVYHFAASAAQASLPAATICQGCSNQRSTQALVTTLCCYSNAAVPMAQPADSSGHPAAAGEVSSASLTVQPKQQLGMADLQELCSRVQLLVSSDRNSSQVYMGEVMDPVVAKKPACTANALLLFVKEVQVVTEVTSVLEQLLELGCLRYRGWQHQVTATENPSLRVQVLQQLSQQLLQDVKLWKQHLSLAQSSCHWLNYFEPCQLFLLEDMLCFWKSPSSVLTDEQRQNALALLQFVKPALRQQQVDAVVAAHSAQTSSTGVVDLTDERQECNDSAAVEASIEALDQLTDTLEALFAPSEPTVPLDMHQQQQAAQPPAASPTASSTPEGQTAGWMSNSFISIVIRDNATSSLDILLQADAALGHQLLQPSRVLCCSSQTTWWQIQLFMQRCFPNFARQRSGKVGGQLSSTGTESGGRQQRHIIDHYAVYALCDVDLLTFQQQGKLLHMFQQALAQQVEEVDACPARPRLIVTSGSYGSVVVSGASNSSASATVGREARGVQVNADLLHNEQTQREVRSAAAVAMQWILQQQGCSVVVLTSDLPGQGKSTTARKLAAAHQQQLYHVLLVDDMHPPCDFTSQLRGWNPQQQVLHIQLLGCCNPAVLQQHLFSLLVLGHISDGLSVYHRPQDPCTVLIEVGNSLGESLLKQVPLLAAADQSHGVQVQQVSATAIAAELVTSCGVLLEHGYRRVHCCFDLTHVDVSSADMRLLCGYLSLSAAGVLDHVTINSDGTIQQQYQQYLPSQAHSRQLLHRAFIQGREALMSKKLLHTFVSVAGRQLRQMSGSCYFTPDVLQYALGQQQPRVRSQLLQAIVAAAASFAVESCSAVRSRQHQQLQATGADEGLQLAARMGSVIGWSESNHLLLLFNSSDDHQTITPLYRHRHHVPDSFRQLLATQILRSQGQDAGLVDYAALSHHELFNILMQLVAPGNSGRLFNADSSSSSSGTDLLTSSYIMTADNLLKMSLVYLRAQCGLPVVMMGDTGCGKTSLLKFLAGAAGVQLMVLNVHAGTTSRNILQAVEDAEKAATAAAPAGGGGGVKQVWLFFDESNTCDHQGLLASIISHRQLPGGEKLRDNIIPMAAINPYRLKPSASASSSVMGVSATAGLRGKLPVSHTGLGRLVYSVQPSPEALIDHVCDYGVLSAEDELAYIRAMTSRATSGNGHRCCHHLSQEMVVELLCTSQQQIREKGHAWDVSLRDVNRCLVLARWFENNMRNRPKPKRKNKPGQWLARAVSTIGSLLLSSEPLQQAEQQQQGADIQLQGLLLALMHTYHSRLASRDHRLQYLQQLVTVFRRHGKTTCSRELQEILRAEQEDYLKRMELPANIAINEALRENVFTAMVCILNKIPLFLVGKPGSSKSLALRLIYANLRGPESSDDFFRQLPALLVFSYQGSESSTSSGIHKVFCEAKQAGASAGPGTTPVVLLDEVGLAEISPHNPLKALHALLEPGYPAQSPDVAVIGISNWALDAAKMSRAVLLSRPEPELDDLSSTAITIWQAAHDMTPDAAKCHHLKQVARAYYQQYNKQSIPDFHGLRDFYALISSLRLHPQLSSEQLYRALLRNFGGPKELTRQVVESFAQQVVAPPGNLLPSIDQLIRDNLQDKTARHLLLIGSGDLAVEVVRTLSLTGRSSQPAQGSSNNQHLPANTSELVVLWGSPWPEDQSEVYRYSMLSDIILRMELGHKLILRDFGIFGALYDMLNQNYCTVGGRNNCRVALGPHANPMCTVHDDFQSSGAYEPGTGICC